MKQLTKEEAIGLSKTNFWEKMSDEEIAKFQLTQERSCMPFDVFHKAVEKTLNRPVWTHEFAKPESLIKELSGDKEKPTFEEIVNLIPKEKRILVGI